MKVFHYNSGNGFAHLEEDYGSITSPPDEMIDGGNLDDDLELGESDELNITLPEKTKSSLFGIKGKSKNICISSEFIPYSDLNSDDIVFVGIVLTWIGFGTAFEFDNGYERIVSPYLSSGDMR